MRRSYGACGAFFFVVCVVFEQYLAVHAASPNAFREQVRVVSRSEEFDSEVVWSTPPLDGVPVSNSNALKICDCEYASTKNHGGLLCNKEGYFITNFEADGHWVRPSLLYPTERAFWGS